MNEALKIKWFSIYGQLLDYEKLKTAWKQVEANKGCGGIDDETIESFRLREEEKLRVILAELRAKEYKPTAVKRVYIPKKDGKMRPLGIPVLKDRIIQQAVVKE
jgi:retron-type reverse transcriptase